MNDVNVAADRSGCFRSSKHHPVLCLATARALERVMLLADELSALVLDNRYQVQAGAQSKQRIAFPRFRRPLLVGVAILASNGCETGCPQQMRRMVYDGPACGTLRVHARFGSHRLAPLALPSRIRSARPSGGIFGHSTFFRAEEPKSSADLAHVPEKWEPVFPKKDMRHQGSWSASQFNLIGMRSAAGSERQAPLSSVQKIRAKLIRQPRR